MPPGLMTSFNVSVGPFYSFFYHLNWLLLLIAQKYLKIPQTSFFPKHGSGSDSCWPSSQPSLGSFQLQLPCSLVGCWNERIQVPRANPQALGMTLAAFFSPDLELQVQMHLGVYKLVNCLFILEDLTNTWIRQKYKFPPALWWFKWDLSSLLTSISQSYHCRWCPVWAGSSLSRAGPQLEWSHFLRGKRKLQYSWCQIRLVDSRKPPALSDHLVSHSSLTLRWKKCQSLHLGLAATSNLKCLCLYFRSHC